MMSTQPRIAVFGPDPLLSVTIEQGGGGDEVHTHAAGQGVWVAHMAAELGACPTLCGLIGGETGATLLSLLERLGIDHRLTPTVGSSGSYVVDRRSGERVLVAASHRPPPTRHEVDDLVATTCAAASNSAVLVLCNPYPAEGFPLDVYETIVADVRALGVPVIVNLSTPRLDRTLASGPELVKCNDWELAAYVGGPVDGGERWMRRPAVRPGAGSGGGDAGGRADPRRAVRSGSRSRSCRRRSPAAFARVAATR